MILIWILLLIASLAVLYVNASGLQESINIFTVSGTIISVLNTIFCIVNIIYFTII